MTTDQAARDNLNQLIKKERELSSFSELEIFAMSKFLTDNYIIRDHQGSTGEVLIKGFLLGQKELVYLDQEEDAKSPVVPSRETHNRNRLDLLCTAIFDHIELKAFIDPEWIEEYNELIN